MSKTFSNVCWKRFEYSLPLMPSLSAQLVSTCGEPPMSSIVGKSYSRERPSAGQMAEVRVRDRLTHRSCHPRAAQILVCSHRGHGPPGPCRRRCSSPLESWARSHCSHPSRPANRSSRPPWRQGAGKGSRRSSLVLVRSEVPTLEVRRRLFRQSSEGN